MIYYCYVSNLIFFYFYVENLHVYDSDFLKQLLQGFNSWTPDLKPEAPVND